MRMAKGQEETPSEGKNIKNRAAYGIRDIMMLFFAKDLWLCAKFCFCATPHVTFRGKNTFRQRGREN